ncbi:hypothetical protein [Nocardia ignorata]|uniref:hypothetical protein n=1 Tax=Nocardia ignorata TaxID=145285 RepID=UPI0012ECC24F|nr:hypothetical protein [Nocardia ignorata]
MMSQRARADITSAPCPADQLGDYRYRPLVADPVQHVAHLARRVAQIRCTPVGDQHRATAGPIEFVVSKHAIFLTSGYIAPA